MSELYNIKVAAYLIKEAKCKCKQGMRKCGRCGGAITKMGTCSKCGACCKSSRCKKSAYARPSYLNYYYY